MAGDPSFYLERLEEFVQASGIRLVYSADIAAAQLRQTYVPVMRKVLPGKKAATSFNWTAVSA